MARALIVGGDGLIGGMLVRRLAARGWDVVATTRRAPGPGSIALDLGSATAAEAPLPRVDVAIFAAAMAGFAECRAAPDLARRVNVESPVALAGRLAGQGTRSVLISTNAVFDGSRPHQPADAPTRPASVYGSLKAEAERGFLALGEKGAVVRLTKVLDPAHALLTRWRDALVRNEPIGAFTDLHLAPIALEDVEAAIVAALGGGRIVQVSGRDDVSYHDAATCLARALGKPATLVAAQSAAAAGIPESDRPRYTSLDASELAARTGWSPPSAYDVVTSVFA